MAKKSNRNRSVAADKAGPRDVAPLVPASSRPDDAAAWTDGDPRFWQVAMALLFAGVALRQIQLASFPFSHDESIHAWFAEGFSNYKFDPVYHGPLLYHVVAAVFAILGKNDFTARLAPSLLGVALLGLTLGPARRWLGHRGTLWCLGLLVISPVMVTYHRHLIHDAQALTLTFGAVLCFQAALENASYTAAGRWARLGTVACLALFVATKANSFFIIAMLISYWAAVQVQRWWHKIGGVRRPFGPVTGWVPLLALGAVAGAAVAGPEWPRAFHLISAAALGLMFLWMCGPRPADAPAGAAPAGAAAVAETPITTPAAGEPAPSHRAASFRTYLLAAYLGLFLYAFFFGHGYQWWRVPLQLQQDPHAWMAHYAESTAAIRETANRGIGNLTGRGAEPLTWADQAPTLPQAPDWNDVADAMPKMLTYWVGQQRAPRLPGRNDYYIVLMTLYELPIVLAALCGIARAGRQRSPFTDLLLWWAFTSFVLYALANEKVPWLLMHVMLPLLLLGGWWLGQLELRSAPLRNVFLAVCALGAVFLLRGVSATNFERAVDHHEPMFYAQTTESYRDALFDALRRTQHLPRTIWVHNDKQWPAVWYMREDAPYMNRSGVNYGGTPPADELRMAVSTVEEWQKQQARFQGWNSKNVEYMIWPRASWPALRPNRFLVWWLKRDALTPDQSATLAAPGDWSTVPVIVATPPDE